MMKVSIKKASCGTLESRDAYMEIEPWESGIALELRSVVELQFGDSIRALAREALKERNIKNAKLRIEDRGALECTLRARLEVLLDRALESAEEGGGLQ